MIYNTKFIKGKIERTTSGKILNKLSPHYKKKVYIFEIKCFSGEKESIKILEEYLVDEKLFENIKRNELTGRKFMFEVCINGKYLREISEYNDEELKRKKFLYN